MGIFPKLPSAALVPLFLTKSRYYMIISPKLSSATLVPLHSRFLTVENVTVKTDHIRLKFKPS